MWPILIAILSIFFHIFIRFSELICKKLEEDMKLNAEARSCTGSLVLHPRSRDIKFANFSITFHGCELVQDTMLELNCGRRYGLIGLNGSGKYSKLSFSLDYGRIVDLYLCREIHFIGCSG